MAEISISKMTKNDVSKVFELEKELLSETSFSKIESTLSNENLTYYVLKSDDMIIGFFECFILSPEAELYDICVDKNYQGKGFSKLMMNHFISLAELMKCETIFLEVNSINKVAISLYEKYGFEVYNTRKNYYGENDAILMRKSLV